MKQFQKRLAAKSFTQTDGNQLEILYLIIKLNFVIKPKLTNFYIFLPTLNFDIVKQIMQSLLDIIIQVFVKVATRVQKTPSYAMLKKIEMRDENSKRGHIALISFILTQ